MTVPIEASRVEYTGNGVTTAFPTQWYFQSSDQVRVRVTPSGGVESIKTEGVDYTVTTPARGSGAGGTVTFLAAPGAGAAIVIERDVTFTQETALRIAGQFEPETHEDALDYQMMALQEVVRDMADLELASGSATIAAGNGLTASGASPVTLHVGAGAGIVVNADDVEVAYGDAGDIVDLTAGVGADGGSMDLAARIDHRHDIITGTPGTISVGDTAAAGVNTSLARSDHRHALPAPAAPANVTKAAAAAGVATTVARADHKHDVTTATAVALTDSTNAEGVATSLARSDHTHSHGARGGGTLHAAATSSVAGFMSAADKASMDVIGAVASKTKVTATRTLQSIPDTTGAVITGWTETADDDNEFNATTGVYTAKAATNLIVSVVALMASAVWAAGEYVEINIRKNGTVVQSLARRFTFDAAPTRSVHIESTRVVSVGVGDTVDVLLAHTQGAAVDVTLVTLEMRRCV